MYLNDEIKNVIDDFFTNSSESVRYISLDAGMMKEISSMFPTDCYIADLARAKTVRTPIAPFMELLKDTKPSVDVVKKYTYSLQRESFISYFKTGMTGFRKDVYIPEELFYEKKRCLQTIYDLITNCVENPIVILNAQELEAESIELIKRLDAEQKCKLFICFDVSDKVYLGNISQFFSEVASKPNYYEAIRYNIKQEKDFSLCLEEANANTFERLLNFFVNCQNFLSLGNACTVAQFFLENRTSFLFTENQTRQIYLEIALIYFYSGNNDEAANCLNYVLEFHIDDSIESNAYLYMTQVLFAKSAFDDAYKYVKIVIQKTNNEPDSPIHVLARMLHYMIIQRRDSQEVENYYTEVLKLLESEYPNNYVYTSLIIPLSLYSSDKNKEHQLEIVKNAYNKALEIGNDFGVSVACHWTGITLAQLGNKDEALEWYHKADEIRYSIGEIKSIIKIRNGISFEYLLRARYKESYNIVNTVLNRINEIKDYTEIIVSLNNIAKPLFFSGRFKEAALILKRIIRIIQLFNIKDFIYCPMNDVLFQQAIIDFLSSDITQAKLIYHGICDNGMAISNNFKVFKPFIEALICVEEDDIKEAEKNIELSIKQISEICPDHVHQIAFIYFQFGYFLNKHNITDKAKQYRNKGIEVSKKYSLDFYNEFVITLPFDKYQIEEYKLDTLNVNLEYLEELAVREQLLNTLHKRIRDSQFLNKLMDFGATSQNRGQYVQNVAQAISDYMLCRSIYIVEKENNEWRLISSVIRDELPPPSDSDWEYFTMQKPNANEKFIKGNDDALFFNLSKYDFVGGVLIYINKNRNYSVEDMNIIGLGLASLQSQLTIINQNEHLMMISSMDQLSQLKNRRALQEKLSTESEMIRRYEGKNSSHFQVTITFIDLDHFKYYNDTFGHEAGDFLISAFSQLLKTIYRRVDFISRFGGDEFVVLLPNTSPQEALRASDRLREGLRKEENFLPKLQKALNLELNVPKEQYLSFSAGICSNFDLEDKTDVSEAMSNADKALYYAKNTGRSKTVLWTEIH